MSLLKNLSENRNYSDIFEANKEDVKKKFKKANPKMSDEDAEKMVKNVKDKKEEGKDVAGKEDGTGPFKGKKDGKGKNKKPDSECNKEVEEAKGYNVKLIISDSTIDLINRDRKKELRPILTKFFRDIRTELTTIEI